MGKVWVLDTETKGTGAHMVPLEKVQKQPMPKARRRRCPAQPRPREAPEPQRPDRFKIVDVMTLQPLLEGASARETVDSLNEVRSLVDVTIHAWDEDAGSWQRLSRGEERAPRRRRTRGPRRRSPAPSASAPPPSRAGPRWRPTWPPRSCRGGWRGCAR